MAPIRLVVSMIAFSVVVSSAAPVHAQVGYLTGAPGKGAVKGGQQRMAQGQGSSKIRGHCGMMNNMTGGMMNPMGTGGFATSFAGGNGFGSGSMASSFAVPFNNNPQMPSYQEMMMMQQMMLYQMMLMQQYYMLTMMQNQNNSGLTQSPYQTAIVRRQTPAGNTGVQTTAYRQAAALQR